MAIIMDGKKFSSELKVELSEETKRLKQDRGITPTLALILVGGDSASELYVKKKAEACEDIGIRPILKILGQETREEDLIKLVCNLNGDKTVHGIMVQLPLPLHINPNKVTSTIALEKDVDGLNPASLGALMTGRECFAAAGAEASRELLRRSGIPFKDQHVVVAGAGEILGKPFAALAINEGASVTICPSSVQRLEAYTRLADILLVDLGRPRAISREMVKKGCAIIDAGNNRVEGKLLGDVDFDQVKDVVSAITPVPGGLGPMLIMMLMKNLLRAARGQT